MNPPGPIPFNALGASDDVVYLRQDDFTAEGFGVFRFDAGLVQAGTWKFNARDAGWSTSLRVNEANGGRIRIELPPPGTLRVRVLSEATGEPVPMDRLEWRSVGGGGSGTGRRTGIGEFELRAPAGRIRIEAVHNAGLWLAPQSQFELRPGEREATLTATPVCLVEFSVAVDGRRTRFIDEVRSGRRDEMVEVEVMTATGVPPETISREITPVLLDWAGASEAGARGEYRYYLRRPGRYRFHVATPGGCAPVPDLEVDAVIGTAIRHTIDLRRLR